MSNETRIKLFKFNKSQLLQFLVFVI